MRGDHLDRIASQQIQVLVQPGQVCILLWLVYSIDFGNNFDCAQISHAISPVLQNINTPSNFLLVLENTAFVSKKCWSSTSRIYIRASNKQHDERHDPSPLDEMRIEGSLISCNRNAESIRPQFVEENYRVHRPTSSTNRNMQYNLRVRISNTIQVWNHFV